MSLLLLFSSTGIALAGLQAITFSAPEAVLVATHVEAGGNTITISAPTAVLHQALPAGGIALTFSAPTATYTVGDVTAAAGSQPVTFSPPFAQLRVVGGTDVFAPIIYLSGVDRSTFADRMSVQVRDILNDQVNTANVVVRGHTPTRGEDIKIYLGTVLDTALIFAGTVQTVDQIYEKKPANVAYHLTCVDYTWLLDGQKVSRTWIDQSPNTIVADIIASFTSGFTTANVNVPSGFGTLEEFTCIDEDVTRALTRLAKQIGGYWYVDYTKDVHFFLTEATDTPQPIASDVTFRDIVKVTDISQVRNRVRVEGAGSQALVERIPGDTVIPIAESTKFAAAGGLAKLGPQRLTYVGREVGGVATTVVGNIAGPASAPIAAIAAGAGEVTAGTHQYKVAFANSTGETLPGSASNQIISSDFLPPGSVANFTAVSGAVGKLAGAYLYKITNVTSRGETTASPSSPYTATALAAPVALVTSEASSLIGKLIGAYEYKVTYVTSLGETLGGTVAARTVAAQTAPGAATIGTHTVAGPLIGTYLYKIGFVSAVGETIGTATGSTSPVATVADAPGVSGDGTGTEIAYAVTYVHPVFGESALSSRTVDTNKGANPVVTVVNLPSGCGWNVYSTGTVAGGTGGTAALFKVAEMAVGSSSFTHVNQTGPAEGVRATLGKNVPLTSVPTGPSGTLARRVYRTKNGGATYYLVAEIADNVTTTFTDNVPDTALTTAAPLENRNGKQINLTGIPLGPTGVVIARRIYRTVASGSEFKLLAEIPNNTTTTFTDNVADSELGQETPPLLSTAGGEQVTLSNIPLGATGTIARRVYRTVASGTELKFVGQISDNVSTTFVDNVGDAELGNTIPNVNDAGSSIVSLTSIPLGAVGVDKRILYRTKAGGSEFFYLDTIPDNTATTYTDDRADSSLGELAPIVSTIGAQAGDLSIVLKSVSGIPTAGWFRADSQLITYTGISGTTLTGIPAIKTATLTRVGQTITATVAAHGYPTGRHVTVAGATQSEYNGTFPITSTGANTFTYEIVGSPVTPATGTITVAQIGALRGALRGGSTVVTVPMLTGIPAAGTGSILYAIKDGDDVALLVQVEDTAAQASLAALLGIPSGVREHFIADSSLTSVTATNLAAAQLALFKDPETRITYQTRDLNTKSGKTITVALAAPQSISGDFKIQSVTLTEIGIAPGLYPLRTVTASTTKFSFEDMLRRMSLAA